MEKKTEKKRKAIIVLDNGGDCTLVLGKYQHTYTDMAQAREDAELYEDGTDPLEWDGNEIEEYPLDLDYVREVEANNRGYRLYIGLEDIDNSAEPYGWGNWYDFTGR